MWQSIAIVGLLSASIIVAQEVNLSGTIVNQANVPVEGLIISLQQSRVRDTTDAEGKFLLRKSGTSVTRSVPFSGERITFKEGQLTIPESRRYSSISLKIFGLNGSQLRAVDHIRPGQPIRIADGIISSKMQLAILTCDRQSFRFAIMKVNDRIICRWLDGTIRNEGAVLLKQADGSAGDSLVITRKETVELAIFRSSLEDNLSIKLDLIPYEVIDLAIAENGRYPDEVGKDLTDYPNGIVNYLMKTGDGAHDYEAWCSEFVAWAYEAGGYPFTGGTQGGWMLQGSTQIRSWFRQKAQFIDRTSDNWETFQPAPGDYIRYETSGGGHSGIVRYVSNDTLYSVEGNVNNTVMLRKIPRWRDYEAQSGTTYIDGIGRRSGTTEVVF
ncbi:MAG: CHAP domain-containing protein [Chitinispirillaceae bacterium]|nr:CHAP domain-containing protein [Chitinispirillaceae bacterium]